MPMQLQRPIFSGFEEDVDYLFMRYFRNQENQPTIYVQNNPVHAYFFNEYVALRNNNMYPNFPLVVITPGLPMESKDYPVYTAPFIRKSLAVDGTLTFYKFESLIWKDFTYQVDAISKDYIIHRKLHALLTNKLFPRLNGARYFKVSDGEYRPLEITNVSGLEADPDGTFRSNVTYLIKIPVWETEPIVQGSTVVFNFELLLNHLLLEVQDLNLDDSYKVNLTVRIKDLLANKDKMKPEDFRLASVNLYNEVHGG